MITFTDLLKRIENEDIAIHTTTEKQAKTLLSELDKRGFKWNFGMKLTTKTYYEWYKENTYYDFDLNKEVWCCSYNVYQNGGYTIIEFTDIEWMGE